MEKIEKIINTVKETRRREKNVSLQKMLDVIDMITMYTRGTKLQYRNMLSPDTWYAVESDDDLINAVSVSLDNIRIDPDATNIPQTSEEQLKKLRESES